MPWPPVQDLANKSDETRGKIGFESLADPARFERAAFAFGG
jgi:hypothetical protein